MNFVIEQLKLLGLNGREVRVFTTLSTFGRMNMTLLAARAGLARTTVHAIVHRLLQQGLLVGEKVGGHMEYQVDLQDVAKRLSHLRAKLHTDEQHTNDEKNVTKITEHVSTQSIYWEVQKYFVHYQGERARVLLGVGKEEFADTAARLLGYVEYAIRYTMQLDVLVSLRDARSLNGTQVLDEKKDVLPTASLVRLNVVPAGYCVTNTDVMIFRDRALIIDLLRVTTEGVYSPHTVEAMKHLLEIACETGWSIDLRSWLGA